MESVQLTADPVMEKGVRALSQHRTSVKIMQGYQINLSHFSCKIQQMVYIVSVTSIPAI